MRQWARDVERFRRFGLVLTVVTGGSLAGFLMWPEPGVRAAGPAEVQVAGFPVKLSGDVRLLARLVAQRYLAASVRLRAAEETLTASRAQLGVSVDLIHLADLLTRAGDTRSILRRVHARYRGGDALRLPMPTALDENRALGWLKRLKDAVDRAPVDARVDPRKQSVSPARKGRSLDLYATVESLEGAMRSGARQVDASVQILAPKRDVGAYDRIEMGEILGDFQTPYSRLARARDRTHNLRVAVNKLDGLVISPGEVFDFNRAVGDRTRSSGFRMAPVISYGKLVDGMGGGTCQVASTLHAAATFAGLPILERNPHSRPSFYIKLGLDAAVAYGTLNFRFKNDRNYPLVLGMTVSGGQVKAAIHGKQQAHKVTFIRRVEGATRFPEKSIDDDKLPRGLRVLAQRGMPGFTITRFRVVQHVATGHARRERGTDRYPPTTQIWRVGTGPEAGPSFAPPENDAHPEYVADEYLRATRTPGEGQLQVVRTPGRYGAYGWTARQGWASD